MADHNRGQGLPRTPRCCRPRPQVLHLLQVTAAVASATRKKVPTQQAGCKKGQEHPYHVEGRPLGSGWRHIIANVVPTDNQAVGIDAIGVASQQGHIVGILNRLQCTDIGGLNDLDLVDLSSYDV